MFEINARIADRHLKFFIQALYITQFDKLLHSLSIGQDIGLLLFIDLCKISWHIIPTIDILDFTWFFE